MRTLKKTLSLLLAVALVLSLTVVGASAAYTGNKVDTLKDAADVGADYSEAVGVMVGLGIIEGYDDGTLRPETTYTREQAAKIIAYMQLGPKDADSLRCTKAPFTDVAADRWSAGYIAYCVEQGIIDGMGDGTFQPEAQLTGYQWAKMLLCAVGYGRNDEYVGSSWSLNTAKDALDKGIFDGDLVGADHTPLQRQQAILYAFNALTGVEVVVYSPSLGDYILRYVDFAQRDTIEGTLGEVVYGLGVTEGIIVDNEGMGNATTVLSKNYGTASADRLCSVAANTGLDMMYHAAKIWHVNGKTAVYVVDLAKVETANCPTDVKKSDLDNTIGEGTKNDKLYEVATIDNSALNFKDKYVVGFYYAKDELGVRSTVKETTVVGAEGAVKNSLIKTDISKINRGDDIIYIKAESTTSDGVAYHVYPVTATTGVITGISNAKQTVTLSDGTVLGLSVFKGAFDWTTVKESLKVGRTFTFVLDTHDHIISYYSVLGAAYFTGTVRFSSEHDAWFADAEYVAQFINVSTGEIDEVPVTAAWVRTYGRTPGVYDAYDVIYGTGKYYPQPISDGTYGSYFVKTYTPSVSFNKDTHVVDGVYFDPDNVTFIVATGKGAGVSVESYTGFAALLEAYNRTGAENTVNLSNLVMTCAATAAGNASADVIFGWDGIVSTEGGYLFVPTDIDEDDWTWDISNGIETWSYDGAYLNGNEFAQPIVLAADDDYVDIGIERGFYAFEIDANGIFTISPLKDAAFVYDVNNMAMSNTGTRYWLTAGGEEYEITDWNVVDLRAGVAAEEVDPITNVGELVATNFHNYPVKVQIAFVPGDGILYVIDKGWLYNAQFVLSDELIAAGWRWLDSAGKTYTELDEQYGDWSNLNDWQLVNVKDGFELVAGGNYVASYGIKFDVYQDDDYVASSSGTVGITSAGDKNVLTFQNTPTLPVLDENQRDIVVKVSGLEMTVNFAFDSAEFSVTPATDTITLGESVTLSVTGPTSVTNTIYYKLQLGDGTSWQANYTIQDEVQGSGYSTDITVTPQCPGTYTIVNWQSSPIA